MIKDESMMKNTISILNNCSEDCYAILQLKQTEETQNICFRSLFELNRLQLNPEIDNYRVMYIAPVTSDEDINILLEDIFIKFNVDRPDDFFGHSLSVSDVVVLKKDNSIKSYYVDSMSFSELKYFIPENYLRNTEILIEDDYGMIDGIINNGKSSVLDKLKEPVMKSSSKTNSRKQEREMR